MREAGEPVAPVFVLGTSGCNGLGLLRAFGRRGIPVTLIDARRSRPHAWCRYGRVLVSPPPDVTRAEAAEFIVRQARACPIPPVLIPTNDDWLLYVLTFGDALSAATRFTWGPLKAARQLIDKAEFYALAEAMGVPHPRTAVPASLNEAIHAAGRIGYPCLLKPSLSIPFAAAFGVKCFMVDDPPDLTRRWTETERARLQMLVQEAIPGRRIHMWYGYYDRSGRLAAACGYRKVRQCPAEFGVGSFVEAHAEPGLVDAADRIIRAAGYSGIVEPEFKFDPGDGRWKILEVNARTSTQNRLPALLGVDMEYLAYLDALGGLRPPGGHTGPPLRGRRAAWTETHKDFASAVGDLRMPLGAWLQSRRVRLVSAWYAEDDPLPAVALAPTMAATAVSAVLRRLAPRLHRRLAGR